MISTFHCLMHISSSWETENLGLGLSGSFHKQKTGPGMEYSQFIHRMLPPESDGAIPVRKTK